MDPVSLDISLRRDLEGKAEAKGPIQRFVWELNTSPGLLQSWLDDPKSVIQARVNHDDPDKKIDPCCAAILASGNTNAIQALVDAEGSFPIRIDVIIKIR